MPATGTSQSLKVYIFHRSDSHRLGAVILKWKWKYQCLLISSTLLELPLTAVKVSILLFYKRVFSSISKMRVAVWITIPFIFVWGVIFFIVSIVVQFEEGEAEIFTAGPNRGGSSQCKLDWQRETSV